MAGHHSTSRQWWIGCLFAALLGPALPLGAKSPADPSQLDVLAIAEAQAAEPVNTFAALDITELMNIQVTSVSGVENDWFTTPAALSVINAQDIRRSGMQSLPELFRLVPGMNVLSLGSHTWAISTRGFNDLLANKLLVMIDGRTIYNPQFTGTFWDEHDLLLEDIDRIEIIRGPGATLWGANAVNGVINIVTRNARDTQGWYLSGLAGTELRALGQVRFNHPRFQDTGPDQFIPIAEGLETYDQVVQLLAMDCQFGQGFYFGKPLPAEQAQVLLETDKPFLKEMLPSDMAV